MPDPTHGKPDAPASEPFTARGRRNSWHGGWRHIGFYVERLDGWWWRKRWAVKMDYGDDWGSTRGQVCSRHRTMAEANAKATATWADIEADHERIEAHLAASRPVPTPSEGPETPAARLSSPLEDR